MGGPAGADENALVLTKTGPTEAKDAGELLLYRITASYPGTAQDVTVTDHLPEGTDFDPSTPPPAHYDPATRTVSWSVKEVVPPVNGLISNINTTFALNLRATAGNIIIVNQADGAVIGEVITPKSPVGGGGPTPEGYIPPNDDSCGGRYALTGNRFLPKNFGNPTCMSDAELKDAVYKQLQKDDAANADWWYFQVLACESGYNPNAWLDPDTLVEGYRSPDAGGAWGLFQDGSSANFPDRLYSSNRTESVTLDKASELPGRPPPAVGHSKDPADRGDLNWSIQIKNAVELLKGRGRGYWACA